MKNAALGTQETPKYIVGIGASAGGLEAIEAPFDHLDVDLGMAYVVVQHHSPDFKSTMEELLSRRTALSINQAQNGMQVEANSIYLLPPRKEIAISNGCLVVKEEDPSL